MLQWWLNFRWASEAYEDTLAKADLPIALCGVVMIVVFVLSLRA